MLLPLSFRVNNLESDHDIVDTWSHRAVCLQGSFLKCSQRTQKKYKEIAESSMTPDHFWKLHVERVSLCPIQTRSQISQREASSSDKLPRVNLHKSKSFFNHSKNTCDFYNHRGYIVVIKNWQSDGHYIAWEFHLPSEILKDCWIRTLKAARTFSEDAENGNKFFFRELIRKLHDIVETRDRYYLMKIYRKCFVGTEFVKVICDELKCSTKEALKIGNNMMSFGLLSHVKQEHELLNDFLFYNFCENNISHLLSISRDPSTTNSNLNSNSNSSENLLSMINSNNSINIQNNEILKDINGMTKNCLYNQAYNNIDIHDDDDQDEVNEIEKKIVEKSISSIPMTSWKNIFVFGKILNVLNASESMQNENENEKENENENENETKNKNEKKNQNDIGDGNKNKDTNINEKRKINSSDLNQGVPSENSNSISFLSFSYFYTIGQW